MSSHQFGDVLDDAESWPCSPYCSEAAVRDANPCQRWIELKKVLEDESKVTWNQVKSLFNTVKYVSPRTKVDESLLDFFAEYIALCTKCFSSITESDGNRKHLVSQILTCVCQRQDVYAMFKMSLCGKAIRARILVDFILESENSRLLVIMAKGHDFQQGMVDALIGCEILAHLSGLNEICAVVTDYMEWTFLKRHEDMIEMDQCSLRFTPDGTPERESLQEITEKINGMLN